jgi:hypothetical protein
MRIDVKRLCRDVSRIPHKFAERVDSNDPGDCRFDLLPEKLLQPDRAYDR